MQLFFRKTAVFLTLLLIATFYLEAKAQVNTGYLTYEYVSAPPSEEQMQKRIAKVKEQIPEGETRDAVIASFLKDNKPTYHDKKLIFKNTQGIYRNESAVHVPFKFGELITYWDLKSNECVAQSFIFNKPFVVLKDQTPLNWTYTEEKKQIGAFLAQKAIAKKDTTFFAQVWFTRALPAFPIEGLFGLKGAVVEGVFASGNKIQLKSFTSMLTKDDKIEKPQKGKVYQEKEFDIFYKQKIKEANEYARQQRTKN